MPRESIPTPGPTTTARALAMPLQKLPASSGSAPSRRARKAAMRIAASLVLVLILGCGGATSAPAPARPGPISDYNPTFLPQTCGGKKLRVAFYNAGQALAALVTLPDDKHILIDAGESPSRGGCKPCKEWHQRVVAGLERDLGNKRIDLLWLTHPHSDHIGGVPDIAEKFKIIAYVDNGRDLRSPVVKRARDALSE